MNENAYVLLTKCKKILKLLNEKYQNHIDGFLYKKHMKHAQLVYAKVDKNTTRITRIFIPSFKNINQKY